MEQRLARIAGENPTRIDYLGKLQGDDRPVQLGSRQSRRHLGRAPTAQDRHVREQLSGEELAIFDLLTKPESVLFKGDEANVKEVARELLATLKSELPVLDWKNRQATRPKVELGIKAIFDAGLPDIYDRSLFATKCSAVYEHNSPPCVIATTHSHRRYNE